MIEIANKIYLVSIENGNMPQDSKDLAENLMGLFPPVTHIHCKCGKCTLHFKIYTWYPKQWKDRDPICPECGEQGEWVVKLRFVEAGVGFIDFN
ncbi:MAG: hypothetical protein ACXAEF_01830 [Candidatus Thorarchaeota archaeon]